MAQGFANHETELATRWLQSTPEEYEHWTERTEEILRSYPSKGKTTSRGGKQTLTVKCLTEEEKGKPQGHKQKGYWILRSDILNAVGKLANELKDMQECGYLMFRYKAFRAPCLPSDVDWNLNRKLFSDLLEAARAKIDWHQIAHGLVESAEFNNTFPLEDHIT